MTIEEFYETTKIAVRIFNEYNFLKDAIDLKSAIINYLYYTDKADFEKAEKHRKDLERYLNHINSVISLADNKIRLLTGEGLYMAFDFTSLTGGHAQSLFRRLLIYIDGNDKNSVAEIQEVLRKLENIGIFSNVVNDLMGDSIIDPEYGKDNELSIIFEDGALITTLEEVSKATHDWEIIVNCFARLVNENDTKVEIISIKRGSLILTIAAAIGILTAIIRCGNKVMDLILKYVSIKQNLEQLKQLKITNLSKSLDLLEKAAELNLDTESNNITKSLLDEYNLDFNNDDYQEINSAINMAVKKIIRFSNAGGKLKPKFIPKDVVDASVVDEIENKNNQIRALQNSIDSLKSGKQILQIEDSGSENE